MSNVYQFETKHFRFTNEELQLLRSRYPYRKLRFQEISRISLAKGIRVKRPIILLIFGLTLTFSSFYVMLFASQYLNALLSYHASGDSFWPFESFGYFLIMGFFLLAIGVVAIFQAIVPTWIMKIELTDGKKELMPMNKLFESNDVFEFVQFLRYSFSDSQLVIDKRIGSKYG